MGLGLQSRAYFLLGKTSKNIEASLQGGERCTPPQHFTSTLLLYIHETFLNHSLLKRLARTYLAPVPARGAFPATAVAGAVPPPRAHGHVTSERGPSSDVRQEGLTRYKAVTPIVVFHVSGGRKDSAGVVTAGNDGDIGVVISPNSVEALVDEGWRGAARSTVQMKASARHLVQFVLQFLYVEGDQLRDDVFCRSTRAWKRGTVRQADGHIELER